jgi:hypothetical protein
LLADVVLTAAGACTRAADAGAVLALRPARARYANAAPGAAGGIRRAGPTRVAIAAAAGAAGGRADARPAQALLTRYAGRNARALGRVADLALIRVAGCREARVPAHPHVRAAGPVEARFLPGTGRDARALCCVADLARRRIARSGEASVAADECLRTADPERAILHSHSSRRTHTPTAGTGCTGRAAAAPAHEIVRTAELVCAGRVVE